MYAQLLFSLLNVVNSARDLIFAPLIFNSLELVEYYSLKLIEYFSILVEKHNLF